MTQVNPFTAAVSVHEVNSRGGHRFSIRFNRENGENFIAAHGSQFMLKLGQEDGILTGQLRSATDADPIKEVLNLRATADGAYQMDTERQSLGVREIPVFNSVQVTPTMNIDGLGFQLKLPSASGKAAPAASQTPAMAQTPQDLSMAAIRRLRDQLISKVADHNATFQGTIELDLKLTQRVDL